MDLECPYWALMATPLVTATFQADKVCVIQGMRLVEMCVVDIRIQMAHCVCSLGSPAEHSLQPNWCSEVEPEGQRKMFVTVSHAAFTICLGLRETFQGLFAQGRTKELIGWLETRSWIKFNKVQKALQAAGWRKNIRVVRASAAGKGLKEHYVLEHDRGLFNRPNQQPGKRLQNWLYRCILLN